MDTQKKGPKDYLISLEISNVSPSDAGSYRVTAKNALGESNATIGLNFDGKCLVVFIPDCILKYIVHLFVS